MLTRSFIASIFAAGSAACVVTAPADAETAMDREAVEKIVHEYLMSHPQVIIDSVNRLQAEQQQKAAQDQAKLLKESRPALVSDPLDPVGGSPNGDVTVVEFFDYNCGFCKKSQPELMAALKADPQLRVVFKELPILSPESLVASKMALAIHAIAPEKYVDFHIAAMQYHGRFDDPTLDGIVTGLKLEPTVVREKMKDKAIEKRIAAIHDLAMKVGVAGTPAFYIGDEFISSAMDAATFKEKIEAARKQQKDVAAR